MTGFKIKFKELPQRKVYSEYLALYKDLPSPPSNVDQEFRSDTAELSLKWNKKRRGYLEENKDICGNNKGHLS